MIVQQLADLVRSGQRRIIFSHDQRGDQERFIEGLQQVAGSMNVLGPSVTERSMRYTGLLTLAYVYNS